MRLAHPAPKLLSIAHARLIALLHPRAEIIGAHPARVHFAEEPEELLGLDLLCDGGRFGVVGCEGVQEGPGRSTKLLDVGRAVGGDCGRGGEGGCCCCCLWLGAAAGFLVGHGEP